MTLFDINILTVIFVLFLAKLAHMAGDCTGTGSSQGYGGQTWQGVTSKVTKFTEKFVYHQPSNLDPPGTDADEFVTIGSTHE